jgi:prepilin-type N-terminal cleavage/methylation domain-containing protein
MEIMKHHKNLSERSRRSGFTFVEILVAMGVLVLFSGAAMAALTQFNRFATASRLRSHALALAQQRIDDVLTTQWLLGLSRPPELTAGTVTETNLVMNADAKNSATALKSDFTDLGVPIACTRTSTVTDISARTLRVTVTVTFTYANRTYNVALNTMRATDNF